MATTRSSARSVAAMRGAKGDACGRDADHSRKTSRDSRHDLAQALRALVRASSNPSHMKQLLHVMETATAERKTQTGPIFHDLAERLKKRGIVLVFSDLFDDVATMMAGLKHFRHRQHDVILLHVLDPAELEFPFRRPTEFKGLEEFSDVSADPQVIRRAYLRELTAFRQSLENECRQQRIDYFLLRTDQPLDAALTHVLAMRERSVR
jgi:uncharacterized protein (DUF58 family)